MRHAHLLGSAEPLMHRLVPTLVAEMGVAYPELLRAQPLIEATLLQEETRFRVTLDNGLRLLGDATADLHGGDTLPGAVAFKLYDTFGFPYDLTEDALRDRGIGVDRAGFDAAMAEQRRARARHGPGRARRRRRRSGSTFSTPPAPTEFTGYSSDTAQGVVVALVRDGVRVDAADAGDSVAVVTNQTPFYAESGGQAGDAGTITGRRDDARRRRHRKAARQAPRPSR